MYQIAKRRRQFWGIFHSCLLANVPQYDYVDVDFYVCTNETSTMTDKEIVDAVSGIEDDVDGEDEEDEESIVVEDEPPQKPSLADVGDAIELIES